MTDAWLHVTRRVLNDQIKGEVRLCDDPSDGVDYPWYFLQYNGVLALSQALAAHKALAPKVSVEEASPGLDAAAPNEFQFGGDYAHQESATG